MRHLSLLKRDGSRPADTKWAVSRIMHLDDVTERDDLAVFLRQEHAIAQHRHNWFSVSPDDSPKVLLNLSHDMNPKNMTLLAR